MFGRRGNVPVGHALHWLDPWSHFGRCPLARLHVLLFCQEVLKSAVDSPLQSGMAANDLICSGLIPAPTPAKIAARFLASFSLRIRNARIIPRV